MNGFSVADSGSAHAIIRLLIICIAGTWSMEEVLTKPRGGN